MQRFVVKKRLTKHPQVYRDASPITRVRPDAPPFFVLHGEDDSLIPVPEAREFVAALRDVSKEPVVYAEIPHAQHAFDFFGSPRGALHGPGRREVPVVGARQPRREVCLLRHRLLDHRQLLGKSGGTADFDERLDHRVGQLVRV